MEKPPLRKPGQLKPGDETTLRARVTRIGRNSWNTADTVTLRIAGFDTPVTIQADHLSDEPAGD